MRGGMQNSGHCLSSFVTGATSQECFIICQFGVCHFAQLVPVAWRREMRRMVKIPLTCLLTSVKSFFGPFLLQVFCHSSHSPLLHKQA